MDSLPLFGTTIVELCHSLAGPYATAILEHNDLLPTMRDAAKDTIS
jgi:hypothetical protein